MTQTQGLRKADPPRRASDDTSPLGTHLTLYWDPRPCVGGAEGTAREEACGREWQGQGNGSQRNITSFQGPWELRAPGSPEQWLEAWVPSTVPSATSCHSSPRPHPATLPGYARSYLCCLLRAGGWAGHRLETKLSWEALSLSSASVGPGGQQVHGVAPSSPDQVETMANTPRLWAVSRLIKVIYYLAEQPRLARLRRAELPGAPVLACKRRQPPASPAQKSCSRRSFGSCQDSADPQRT